MRSPSLTRHDRTMPSSIVLPACGMRMGVTFPGVPGDGELAVSEGCCVTVVSGLDCGAGALVASTCANSAPTLTVRRGWARTRASVPDCDASR